MNRLIRLTIVGLLVLLVVVGAFAQRAVLRAPKLLIMKPQPTLQLDLSALQRSQEFGQVLSEHKVAGDKQTEYIQQFRNLPSDLQESLLTVMSPKWAKQVALPTATLPVVRARELIKIGPILLLKLALTSFWPDEGSPDCWAYAFGFRLNENCQIYFDGSAVETYYLGWAVEFFPSSLAFRVPAGASVGTEHDVYAHNTATGKDSATKQYRIIVLRGYRGTWGWQFSNFSRNTIAWHLFRDFFGAAAVENPDGTPKPAAAAWYHSRYKGVGGGGNCYGMSVSSLRGYNDTINTYHQGWFANPANHENFVWPYPWRVETRESVQEDQGGQLSLELATYINNYYNTQSSRDVWNRVQSNLLPTRPVLGMWSGTGGHAVVPYGTQVSGDDHQIRLYDNNNPYSETESGSPDPNVAHVAWGANTFSYGGYFKAVCLTYAECITPPHLPTEAVGGLGAETAIAVVGADTELRQITDEEGHTFFNADGTVNEDPTTRIPFSMKFIPLTGGPVPPDAPQTFIFTHATGKSLSFNLQGAQSKVFHLFMPGSVFVAEGIGTGQVRVRNIAQSNRSLILLNPSNFQPTRLEIIKSLAIGDRVFELQNLRNLGTEKLQLIPAANGSSLQVIGQQGAEFDMILQGPRGQGMHQGSFLNIGLQAGTKAILTPTQWGNLSQGSLDLQLRNLQNNQLQQRLKIKGR